MLGRSNVLSSIFYSFACHTQKNHGIVDRTVPIYKSRFPERVVYIKFNSTSVISRKLIRNFASVLLSARLSFASDETGTKLL